MKCNPSRVELSNANQLRVTLGNSLCSPTLETLTFLGEKTGVWPYSPKLDHF